MTKETFLVARKISSPSLIPTFGQRSCVGHCSLAGAGLPGPAKRRAALVGRLPLV